MCWSIKYSWKPYCVVVCVILNLNIKFSIIVIRWTKWNILPYAILWETSIIDSHWNVWNMICLLDQSHFTLPLLSCHLLIMNCIRVIAISYQNKQYTIQWSHNTHFGVISCLVQCVTRTISYIHIIARSHPRLHVVNYSKSYEDDTCFFFKDYNWNFTDHLTWLRQIPSMQVALVLLPVLTRK